MSRTTSKSKNKQRAITPESGNAESFKNEA
jgi:hypothetical protein